MTIGPSNSISDNPINPQDRGGIHLLFEVNKERRLCVMRFGTSLSWLAFRPNEMLVFTRTIRSRITQDFGRLHYNKDRLPIQVVANLEQRVVELYLPQEMRVLTANPEMWLALTEVMEDNVKKLRLH